MIEEKLYGSWNKLNTSLHCIAYALNPKWHNTKETNTRSPYEDREVMKRFWVVVKEIYGQGDQALIKES